MNKHVRICLHHTGLNISTVMFVSNVILCRGITCNKLRLAYIKLLHDGTWNYLGTWTGIMCSTCTPFPHMVSNICSLTLTTRIKQFL